MPVVPGPQLEPKAVDWLLRFPLLGSYELALFLGVHRLDAEVLLRQLEGLAWVERVTAESPEVDRRPFFALSTAAIERLNADWGQEALLSYPATRREVYERMLRLETAVGLNRFFARLAGATSGSQGVRLTEARSLPWVARRAVHWWPPAMEAYSVLQNGRWTAPLFVAWDRAGAPNFHRRARVRGWYAFRERAGGRRGHVPNILVLCPGRPQARVWERSVMASADRRGCEPLHMAWAPISEALDMPASPIWRRLGGERTAPLEDRLQWERQSNQRDGHVPSAPLTDLTINLVRGPSSNSATEASGRPTKPEVLARVALGATAQHITILRWLARHPFLAARELSALLDVPGYVTQHLVDDVKRRGLIDCISHAQAENHAETLLYFLTQQGLELLAVRDGVPPRRYGEHASVAASGADGQPGKRLLGLRTHLKHTVGANRFFVRLIENTRNGGGRLKFWLGPSDCARQFIRDGRSHWVRPDGCGGLVRDAYLYRFFLEWDRGTVRQAGLLPKLQCYVAYFEARHRGQDRGPVLFVTTTPYREDLVWKLAEEARAGRRMEALPLRTTRQELIDNPGPLGPVWRKSRRKERSRWP